MPNRLPDKIPPTGSEIPRMAGGIPRSSSCISGPSQSRLIYTGWHDTWRLQGLSGSAEEP